MNVTLTSLEALILKATHESLPSPDAAALEAFCAVMRDSAEGPQLAAQALAARIHSTNMREAMLALSLIDRCMRRCDANFHAEVGKFRFLNEMIKLVSPKYLADKTAPEVRTRVLQLLHAWSLEYPKETKFKVAYEMLKNQGVVKETPPPLPPEEGGPPSRSRAKNAVFDDEEKSKLLQKLLQSKKPEDIQHANRLIKSMVREEERRNEVCSQRAMEVTTARDSAHLLNDMLDYAKTEIASVEEELIIQELHIMCTKMGPLLQQIAAVAANDINADNLNEVLGAIDLLYNVQLKYKLYMEKKKSKKDSGCVLEHPQASNSESLLDFAGVNTAKAVEEVPKTNVAKKNALDELSDIFSTEHGNNLADDVALVTQPLKPVNLMPNDDDNLLGDKTKTEGWNELDSLGEQLLKQSLPVNARRVDNFNSKSKKIPMNALTSPKHDPAASNGAILDLDFFNIKPEEPKSPEHPLPEPVTPNDDVMVDISTEPNTSTNNLNNRSDSLIFDFGTSVDINAICRAHIEKKEPMNNDVEKKITKSSEVKPLTDINVTLQSVTPSDYLLPLTVLEEEEGVTVVLHYCKDKPRPDVNVIVISTTSKSSSPIEDYKFQSVVPKGCKVRLLTPSGTSLPAYNPFLPPPALTQVMLVARPPSINTIDLKFVVTYTCDEETCSEMGEVEQFLDDDE